MLSKHTNSQTNLVNESPSPHLTNRPGWQLLENVLMKYVKMEVQMSFTFLVPIMSKAVYLFMCSQDISADLWIKYCYIFLFFLFVVNLFPFMGLLFIYYLFSIFLFFGYLGELIDSMLQIANSFLLSKFYF